MGAIFKDIKDDQQEGLMESLFIGQTWQFRYLKIKAWFWGTVATATGMGTVALTDYLMYKFTDYAGLMAWILG